MQRFFALIPAAGRGLRMDPAYPKQYLPLLGRPMIYHSVRALADVAEIERIFVVLARNDSRWSYGDWYRFGSRLVPLYCGGVERRETVLNGLREARGIGEQDWVLVHDAVRPCATSDQVRTLMHVAGGDEVGGLLAIPVADTLKRSDDGESVAATVDRRGLWQAQTPQMFRYQVLLRALEVAEDATDEAQAVEALGFSPKLVRGDSRNLKVTLADDLRLAEMILSGRRG
ncbi:MAG: 2-C-methyl-D-erythritol 4-phosphate cytidylyltransferase [Burkholderiales bacterium]